MKKKILALLLWALIPLSAMAAGTGFHDIRLDLGDIYDTNSNKVIDVSGGTLEVVRQFRQKQGNSASDLALSTSTSLTTSNLDTSFVTLTSTGGALTVGSLPTIATTTATAGDRYTLLSTTATLTFSDNDQVAGTLLELGASTRALGVGDILELIYHNSSWWEIGFYNN